MSDPTAHYSILIQWSEADSKYIVSLPEFGPYAHSHGPTRESALRNGEDALSTLIETYKEQGKTLPEPGLHSDK